MLEVLDAQLELPTLEDLEELILRAALGIEAADLQDDQIVSGLLKAYGGLEADLADEPQERPARGKGAELYRTAWVRYVARREQISLELAGEQYTGVASIDFDQFPKALLVRFARAAAARDCARWKAWRKERQEEAGG